MPILFPDAELAKNDVEKVLDIDTAGNPPECVRCPPELLGNNLGPRSRRPRRQNLVPADR